MLRVRWSDEDYSPETWDMCPQKHPVSGQKEQILRFPPQQDCLIGLANSRVVLGKWGSVASLIACGGDEVAGNQTHLF